MSDANDDAQNYALGAIAAVVALVIAGVLTLALARSGPSRPAPAAAAAAAESAPRVYFEVDSDALPADAMEVLDRVAEQLRARPGAAVLISGFHDASGNPEHNAELAKRRAQAARQALEAKGVPAAQLVLDKPRETLGGGDAREARRVELRLQ